MLRNVAAWSAPNQLLLTSITIQVPRAAVVERACLRCSPVLPNRYLVLCGLCGTGPENLGMRAGWERDAGVQRVSILTRAAVAGSVALSVAFTAVVAWTQPGRAKSATATSGYANTSRRGQRRRKPSDDAPTTLPTDGGRSRHVAAVGLHTAAGHRLRRWRDRLGTVVRTALDQARFEALGTTAIVLVSEPSALADARAACERVVAEVDAACSRFRDDSDLTRVNQHAGEWVAASSTLLDALEVGIVAHAPTDGLVDPSVGRAMCDIGYDRDFADIVQTGPAAPLRVRRVPGWQCIEVDRRGGRVRDPEGVSYSTSARLRRPGAQIARHVPARTAPASALRSASAATSRSRARRPTAAGGCMSPKTIGPRSTSLAARRSRCRAGGIATSGTTLRHWKHGDASFHHIIDPQRGRPAADCWRMVTVAAPSCTDANVASTASVVLGFDAPRWLAARDLPARLVGTAGNVIYVGGWPSS